MATNLDAATARTVRLLCLGIGGIVILHLLTQNIRFASIGLVVALSGYVVEIAGALRERRVAARVTVAQWKSGLGSKPKPKEKNPAAAGFIPTQNQHEHH